LQTKAALLLYASKPDLYVAKLNFEESLKHCTLYGFAFTSPLDFVESFFSSAFSPKQLKSEPIAKWREESSDLVKNTAFIPLSLWVEPVVLAGAYLQWTKKNNI